MAKFIALIVHHVTFFYTIFSNICVRPWCGLGYDSSQICRIFLIIFELSVYSRYDFLGESLRTPRYWDMGNGKFALLQAFKILKRSSPFVLRFNSPKSRKVEGVSQIRHTELEVRLNSKLAECFGKRKRTRKTTTFAEHISIPFKTWNCKVMRHPPTKRMFGALHFYQKCPLEP